MNNTLETTAAIGVLPVGMVPEIAPKITAAHISGYLNLPATVLGPADIPEAAFDSLRLQYDAGRVLDIFESRDFGDVRKVVAVLDIDLFVPIFTHVFGEARQGGNVALVSLYRLGKHPNGSTPASPLLHERTAKVSLHELGHLFGLFHCEDDRCLMHFSGGLEALDRLPLHFCRYCLRYFNEAVANGK
ncbi:hypothetical protein D3OALGB2SA_2602 [Olavius algarvensis associated proteobacterium Delta 3]|nr:hypothetical protein D3OALGB2SA_2602 [Olavius algarvensis associated proteobacterium Delta 3]